MRVSGEDEVVIKDFDDLKDCLGDVPAVKEIVRLYFLGHEPRRVFKTYTKSREGLEKLLRKDKWEMADAIEAIKKGIKVYAGRDYLDVLLESKEKELGEYINQMLIFYPELVELSREHLLETQRKLTSSSYSSYSYISRFVSRLTGKENRQIRESDDFDEVVALKYVLFHPMQRYSSYASAFTFAENLNANRRVRIMNDCRIKVFKTLKQISPREFYKKGTRLYNELNTRIKLTDRQEELEREDRILLDSLLKNSLKVLCTHNPPHYGETRNPKEFLHGFVACPDVKKLLFTSP